MIRKRKESEGYRQNECEFGNKRLICVFRLIKIYFVEWWICGRGLRKICNIGGEFMSVYDGCNVEHCCVIRLEEDI